MIHQILTLHHKNKAYRIWEVFFIKRKHQILKDVKILMKMKMNNAIQMNIKMCSQVNLYLINQKKLIMILKSFIYQIKILVMIRK